MTSLRALIERRPRVVLALFALLLQLPTLLVWRPLILPDEAGFLLNAYQLGANRPPSGFVYYPGYSLLLAPAAAFTTDLESVMWAVHAVNSGLAIASILLAYALARRLRPEISTLSAAAIAGLTQLYPAFRLFSALALSENLMVPASLLLAVLAVDTRASPNPQRSAYLLGLVGGSSFLIHARSISFTAAAGLCLLIATRRRGRTMLGPIVVWAVSSAGAYTFVNRTISSRGVTLPGNDTGSSLRAILDRSTTLSAVPEWLLASLGQTFYLTISSGGVLIVAAGLLLTRWRQGTAISPERLAAVGTLLLPLSAFTFGVSVLFMAGKGGDPAIYGRYNEGALAPVLVLGLTASSHRKVGQRLMIAAWFVPIAAAVLVLARPADFYEPRRQMINITGIHPVTDTFDGIRLGLVAVFGVCVILLARAAFSRRFGSGLVVLAIVWASVIAYDLRAAVRALDVLDRQDVLIDAIEELETTGGTVSCVTIDLVGIGDRWTEANYRLRRADIDFRYWLSDRPDEPPCPDLVISRRADLATSVPGAALLAVEPGGRIGLFASPGKTQDLALAGRSALTEPFAPLALDTPLNLQVIDAPTQLDVGEAATVIVQLTNVGSTPLVPHLGLDGIGGVNLGLEWRDPTRSADRLMEPVRLPLRGIVWPGETIEISGDLMASNVPIAEGDWHLLVGVVQEGVAWLETEQRVTVRVTGPS